MIIKLSKTAATLEYNNGVMRVVTNVTEPLTLSEINPWARPMNTAENASMRDFLLKNMNTTLQDAVIVHSGGHLIDFKPVSKIKEAMNQRHVDAMLDSFGAYSINGEAGRNVHIIHTGERSQFQVNGIDLQTSSGKDFYSLLPELRYSPYSLDVHAMAQIERLACLNGMTTNDTTFMSKLYLPNIKSLKESAERAQNWITSDVQKKMQARLPEMMTEFTTVRELMVVYDLLSERVNDNESDLDATFRLNRLRDICNVHTNEKLKSEYTDEVYSDMKSADRVSSFVTLYDALQILTEAASHTHGSDDHNMKLNRLAAKWLFEGGNLKRNTSIVAKTSIDSQPMALAFYGV
jgi:hypothetical protein